MTGRITQQILDKVEEAAALGMPRHAIAKYIGVPRRTLTRWTSQWEVGTNQKYVDLWRALTKGEARNAARNLMVVNEAAQDGQWQAGAWLLERRHGMTRDQGDSDDETAATEASTDDAAAALFGEFERLGLL